MVPIFLALVVVIKSMVVVVYGDSFHTHFLNKFYLIFAMIGCVKVWSCGEALIDKLDLKPKLYRTKENTSKPLPPAAGSPSAKHNQDGKDFDGEEPKETEGMEETMVTKEMPNTTEEKDYQKPKQETPNKIRLNPLKRSSAKDSYSPLSGPDKFGINDPQTLKQVLFGRPISCFRTHKEGVVGMDLILDTKDVPSIVTWSYDGTVHLWNTRTGEKLGSLIQGHNKRHPTRPKSQPWGLHYNLAVHIKQVSLTQTNLHSLPCFPISRLSLLLLFTIYYRACLGHQVHPGVVGTPRGKTGRK